MDERIRESTAGDAVLLRVNPGVCGLDCFVRARLVGKRQVAAEILESECAKVRALGEQLSHLTLVQLLAPVGDNPVYEAAHDAGLHPSCILPAAILKACESALGLAVPCDAGLVFYSSGKKGE